MDLIFSIAGLLLVWSLMSYLQREKRVLTRLSEQKPKDVFSLEVPYGRRQVLYELNHFAKRNHLNGCHINSTALETWILKSDKTPDLRFPVYIRQISKSKSILEIGAASLNGTPYVLIRGKHQDAAKAIGSHLKSSWLRKKYYTKVAKSEVAHPAKASINGGKGAAVTRAIPADRKLPA